MQIHGLMLKRLYQLSGWYEDGLIFNQPAAKRQAKKFASQIKNLLKDEKLLDETIGIDVSLSSNIRRSLEEENINTSIIGSNAMIEARSIKTRDEVECLRIAASVVEACFAKICKALKPGITENDMISIIYETAYSLGAETLNAHCDSGPHTWPNFAFHTDRIVRLMDLVYMDIYNLSYLGYRTCYYRTFSCGKPTQAQKDTYKQVRDWTKEAIKAIKPGITTKDLAEKWPKG